MEEERELKRDKFKNGKGKEKKRKGKKEEKGKKKSHKRKGGNENTKRAQVCECGQSSHLPIIKNKNKTKQKPNKHHKLL